MRLDKLRRVEISLMRKSFEIACKRVGLSTARDTDGITDDHACLASEVQALVEQGYTDVTRIAERAIGVLARHKSMH
jgi:hypothetical protein